MNTPVHHPNVGRELPRARAWRAPLIAVVVVVALAAAALAARESAAHTSGLATALAQRGRVVILDGSPWRSRSLPGTQFVPPSAAVLAALAADASDGRAVELAAALDDMGAWGLLVESRAPSQDSSALARLATYQRTPPLRALYLTPTEALYTRDLDSVDAVPEGALLARVARGIRVGR